MRAGNFPSRSRIRKRARQPASSRSITRFLIAWVTQLAVGCAVVPSTRTRLVACSMTARMYWRCPLRVTVSMKSQASRASACERRKSAQVVDARSGAGSMTCLLEDLPDRGRRDLDAERGELAVHPPIAPARVLPDQAQDEGADGADGGRAPRPLRPAGTGMTPFHQIAVPAQDGVRPDEKPQPAQDLAGQRGQERGEEGPVLGRESHPGVGAELPFKDGDLVTQGENLHVLVPIAHRQQPQRGESVRDGQVGQAKEHSGSSCRTRFRLPGDRNSRTPREALAES